jgi:hypothetical protein
MVAPFGGLARQGRLPLSLFAVRLGH